MMTKTYHRRKEEVSRSWHIIDAEGKVLGRLATYIARLLMGKNKVDYSPHVDLGDNVLVFNCEKVVLTGNKVKDKVYRGHSGYPGGFKEVSFEKMLKEHPERIIEKAVSGMLPDNRLKDKRMKRLKVIKGDSDPFINKIKSLTKK
jgi:large subunit ribosomal protein L13